MSQIEITDPSSELAQLAKAFPSKAKKPARVVEVLASVIDVDVDGPVLLELLASITKRLQNLRTFALDLSPSEVPDQLRKQIIGATDAFSRLLGPNAAHLQWDEARQKFLAERHVAALEWFGQTARKYRPLRVVSLQERDEIINRISETITKVKEDSDLQNWERMLIVEGLLRLQFSLRYFIYFGLENAISELFFVKHQIEGLQRRVQSEVDPPSKGASILHALNVIVLIGGIYILPHEVWGASKDYIDWFNRPLTEIRGSQEPNHQRLLAPPVGILPSPKDGE